MKPWFLCVGRVLYVLKAEALAGIARAPDNKWLAVTVCEYPRVSMKT